MARTPWRWSALPPILGLSALALGGAGCAESRAECVSDDDYGTRCRSSYALIGHDSGGLVARLVAAQHGRRVAGLVLGNTEIPGHTSWLFSLILLIARLPGGGPRFLSALRVGALRRSILGLGGCFSDPRYIDGPAA